MFIKKIKNQCEQHAKGNNSVIRPLEIHLNNNLWRQLLGEVNSMHKIHWDAHVENATEYSNTSEYESQRLFIEWDAREWGLIVGEEESKNYEIPLFKRDSREFDQNVSIKWQCMECGNKPFRTNDGKYYCPKSCGTE